MAQERECPALAESALLQQALGGRIGKLVDAQTQGHVVKRIYTPPAGKGRGSACVYIRLPRSVLVEFQEWNSKTGCSESGTPKWSSTCGAALPWNVLRAVL